MRIKVAIVDIDTDYLQRVKNKLRKDYADRIEAAYYSDFDIFSADMKKNRMDLAVINVNFMQAPEFGMIACPVLLISEDNAAGKIGKYPVIGKYQRFEELYKNIISVYSDNVQGMEGYVPASAEGKKIIVFASPAGGTGSSTMAIACAEHFAQRGLNVIYLNFERMPFYYYTGYSGGFEDIMFTLSENRSNISLKLESVLIKTQNNVRILPSIKNPLDLCSLSNEDIDVLLKAVLQMEGIDHIVIDADFGLDERTYMLFDKATHIVFTTDGRVAANNKTTRAIECLKNKDSDFQTTDKIRIIYNRFSSGNFNNKMQGSYPELFVFPRYKATTPQIIAELSNSNAFDQLM